MMISQKNGENVYNPLQLKAILNCMYIGKNTVRQDLAKKIGKNFYSPLWHESQQTARKFQYHKTRMSTQFLKDDFPETFPNMDMKTGKGKKKLRKDHNSHSLLKSRVAHFQSDYD